MYWFILVMYQNLNTLYGFACNILTWLRGAYWVKVYLISNWTDDGKNDIFPYLYILWTNKLSLFDPSFPALFFRKRAIRSITCFMVISLV